MNADFLILTVPAASEGFLALCFLSAFIGFILSIVYWVKAAKGTAGYPISGFSFLFSGLGATPFFWMVASTSSDAVGAVFGGMLSMMLFPLLLPLLFTLIAFMIQATSKKIKK